MPKDKKTLDAAGGIVVTSQQSRFHADATDAPESKEIDIDGVSITIGGREVLAQAHLKLQEGLHYVLVGRNGTGKSTILRALAERRVPGVAWNLQMLLLGQTTAVAESIEKQLGQVHVRDESGTVLEHVVASDSRRTRALRDSKGLSEALENTNDHLAIVRAVRKLKHTQLEERLAQAKDIASRRSGARGIKARKELIAMEERVEGSKRLVQQASDEIEAAKIQEETQQGVEILSDIQTSLEAMGAHSAESRARLVLLGLGFPEKNLEAPFTSLSGGWRTRCDLACALFQDADLLMLDEPTNFLDLPAVMWLQGYIQGMTKGTVIVVTHDRDFADAVGEELLVLRDKKLERFKGNISLYERERYERQRYLSTMKEAQDRKVKHMEETIEGNIRAAKKTGDDKKLKQAASRRKKIEERTGLEVGLKGGRFKLNRDLAGYHTTNRAAIDIPQDEPEVKISLPGPPPDLRFPGALVSVENVSYVYPGKPATQSVLYNATLVIHPGERVGLCGLNGSGKSTLISMVVGQDANGRAVAATRGNITRHPRVKMGLFNQHSVEDIEKRGSENKELTALSELLSLAGGELTEPDARKILGSLGLQGRVASDVPIVALSGGQKVRLALAKIVWSPPHLLVLDEVSTHLDSDTILALADALKLYEGAILLVTHDRFFMRCVVEGEPTREKGDDESSEGDDDRQDDRTAAAGVKQGKVYRMMKGRPELMERGMQQYQEIAEKKVKKYLPAA